MGKTYKGDMAKPMRRRDAEFRKARKVRALRGKDKPVVRAA